MRIGTMTEEREPTNWNILKRWWKRAKESDRVQMIGWIVWTLLMLFFAANMAQAGTVYAYSSASDCDADRDANPKALYVATYVDEWALIADTLSNYTFYSLGGDKCYRVTADHRATLSGAMRIEGTSFVISVTASGAVLGPVKSAIATIVTWGGWKLIGTTDPLEVAISLRNDRVADRFRDPCAALIADIATQP